MNEPSTVTYPTADILQRIEDKLDSNHKDVNQKLDKMSERLTNLEVGQAKLTEKVEGMDNRLKVVEGTQKNQVWALIVLLGGAIVTAGARFFFTTNP
ncbi:hypothetical protein [Crocosphaera chwakensis]|uniref:Uncharacterized protein n=1 Tax=Crocosphaera chwakensis CCY0110 TaxID=391612 RepID=A3IS83_9CHRO|nr:hypothetical protein [Crocosphaera chwakensis]EAZ90599.1 hypothetical protein CY0110_07991 [Crocosphaera chwakensis CCY0110]